MRSRGGGRNSPATTKKVPFLPAFRVSSSAAQSSLQLFFSLGNLPSSLGLEQLTHKLSMDGMAGLLGGDTALHGHSEESEVADDIQDLMTDELVVESQRRFVEHSRLGQNYGV